MKNIPLNRLALSNFGFAIAHLCFAFFFAASDINIHIFVRTLSGREVVCFLVGLSHRTMCILLLAFPSVKQILWILSMRLIILYLHPCSSNLHSVLTNITSSDVCVVLATSMYFNGKGNDSSLGTYSLTLGSTWWRQKNSPVIVQKSFLASSSSRVESSWCGVGECNSSDFLDVFRRCSRPMFHLRPGIWGYHFFAALTLPLHWASGRAVLMRPSPPFLQCLRP